MDAKTLRFPRVEDKTSFVLVHVTRCGSLPLDLKIEATEGESPYVGYCQLGWLTESQVSCGSC